MSQATLFDSIVWVERRFDAWLDRFFEQAARFLFAGLRFMAGASIVLMISFYTGYGLVKIAFVIRDNGLAGLLSLFGVS